MICVKYIKICVWLLHVYSLKYLENYSTSARESVSNSKINFSATHNPVTYTQLCVEGESQFTTSLVTTKKSRSKKKILQFTEEQYEFLETTYKLNTSPSLANTIASNLKPNLRELLNGFVTKENGKRN